ncbi:hypothetical protein [Bradyrhizobium sp. WSM1417]|uniref:hypothetical protein n=1 Tax=Bradyrhizobium sp. WSM1417 TaxID=754500 RepID=UPI0004AC6CA5|nr:hypothetical protein [Bradyrhizobium sp. WSM1417]
MALSFTPAPLDASNSVSGFVPGLPPPVDIVELLPPSARRLLLAVRQQTEDAAHVLRPLLDQYEELRGERHKINARIAQLKTPRGRSGPGLDDDDTSVVDAQRKLDAVDAEMVRLSELIAVRRARLQNLGALLARLEGWPREGRPGGTAIVAADEIDTGSIMKKNESPVAALDRIRHRLRELAADRHRVECASFPSSHAKARARAMIEQLAERGAVDVGPLVEADHEIVWPSTMTRLGLAAVAGPDGTRVLGHAMGEQLDTQALLAWLLRDAIVVRLEAEIDAVADDAAALPAEARAEKLAEIASDVLSAERAEAALVWALQRAGQPIEHRADANPLAVLGIQLVAGAPAVAGPVGMAAAAMQHALKIFGVEPPSDASS